ncbi:MAG: hypothetical protein ACOYM3_30860, partial [Terrimicrobiaceae bacterium]
CQLGKILCFNSGQSAAGELPHFVLLEWRARGDYTAIWNGAGRVLRAEAKPGGMMELSPEFEDNGEDFRDESN